MFYAQFANTRNIQGKIADLKEQCNLSDEQISSNNNLLGLLGQSRVCLQNLAADEHICHAKNCSNQKYRQHNVCGCDESYITEIWAGQLEDGVFPQASNEALVTENGRYLFIR